MIKGPKWIYLFTDSSFLVLRVEDLELFEQFKYIQIKDIKEEKNNMIINYMQKSGNETSQKVNCEEKTICHKVNKILQEELEKMTDTNYWNK